MANKAIDRAKMVCAWRAAELVMPGMRVGLGTGSTAAHLVRRLGERVRQEGLEIDCVSTSEVTEALARSEGLRMYGLDDIGQLDLTIDGADEIDPELSLIKGAGAALLREKIVAMASDQMVVIADASKQVEVLGAFKLPVEVVQFGHRTTARMMEEMLQTQDVMTRTLALRTKNDAPVITDEGHVLYDLSLGRIGDARALSIALNQIPGVVENGLFTDICTQSIIGFADGRTQTFNLVTDETTERFFDLGDDESQDESNDES